MYDDVINDPKVMRLPEATRWHWVAVLCAASKTGGRVPPLQDLAFMLRMKDSQAATLLAELHAGGLLDKTGDGFVPHNWSGRQYASDSSAERMRRHRSKKTEQHGDVTSDTTSDVTGDVTVTVQNRTETDTDTESDGGGVGRASAPEPEPAPTKSKSLISEDAFTLATEVLEAMGIDNGDTRSIGAPYSVQAWLNAGWPGETILAGVKLAMQHRKGDPPSTLRYFEKAIARQHAELSRQMPVVNIIEGETINVKAAQSTRPESLGDVARRHAAAGISFGPKPTGLPSKPEGGPALRLLSQG
jgi:hypothetical protein